MSNRRSFLQSTLPSVQESRPFPSYSARSVRADVPHSGDGAGGLHSRQHPGCANLPFKMDGGVKVFNLVAEPVETGDSSGRVIDLWGYNGSAPGPTIQVNQGDRVRIVFDNHLPEPTSIHCTALRYRRRWTASRHWSETYRTGWPLIYEFTLHQEGTYFYHSHMACRRCSECWAHSSCIRSSLYASVASDHVILLQEYAVLPNNTSQTP